MVNPIRVARGIARLAGEGKGWTRVREILDDAWEASSAAPKPQRIFRGFDDNSPSRRQMVESGAPLSALRMRLAEGRTIEEVYQTDVKGASSFFEGRKTSSSQAAQRRGITEEQLYEEYKSLWRQWFDENPDQFELLAQNVGVRRINDSFAAPSASRPQGSDNNQARAIHEILTERGRRALELIEDINKPDKPELPKPAFTSQMNYKDGDQGLRMRLEHRGKSTMDLIISGDRTATTRRMGLLRSVKPGTIIKFKDNRNRTVLARVTSKPALLRVSDDPEKMQQYATEWSQLEGWAPSHYEKFARQGYGQYTYEVIAVNDVPVAQIAAQPVRRIELGQMTEAEIEQERRRIAVRTARVDPQTGAVDQIDAALAEESARALGITEAELARAAKEKNKVMRIRAAEEARRRRALEGLRRGRGMGEAGGDIRIEDIARAAPELLDSRTYLHMEEAQAALAIEKMLEAEKQERLLNFNFLTTPASSLPKIWRGTPLEAVMKAMDKAFPLQRSGVRAIDPDMFPDATEAELLWLADEGVRVARTLVRVTSGDFVDNEAKKLLLRIAERGYRNLRKVQTGQQSRAIDEFFDGLYSRAMNAKSNYGVFDPRDLDPMIGRADIDAIWTGLEINPSQRIVTSLLDADGKPHKVSFRYDGTYDLTISPSAIEIDGSTASIEQLEALLESNADFFDIIDSPQGFWHFALGERAKDSIARRFSNPRIRVKSNGENLPLHEAFILDVLGWRQRGVTPGAGVQRFLLDLISETKFVKDKKGNTVRVRVARDKPLPLMSAEVAQTGGSRQAARPASEFYEEYKALILQSVEPEEFATLASTIGRRSLRSVSPLQALDRRLTPEYALTDILNESGLRPTAPKASRPRPPVAPESPDTLPPVPAQNQDEVFHVYSVGEIAEMPREMAESMLGVRRYDMPEQGLLNMLGIDRPYMDRIVSRPVKGRKPRPKRSVTETQRRGILEQKTPEQKELAKLKATDEYGFSLLEPETGTVDILRKPNTERHFGNPYPIDDSENAAQRIWANQKFEHYFLHGQSVEAWNNAAGKSLVFNNARWMRRNFWRLRGKKLSCVCRGHYCHGEVLLRYAESPDVGLLIERFGDDPEILGDMLEEWLQRASAGSGSWAEHIQALESMLGDSLTSLPTSVNLRIQPGDLFMDRVLPKPGTPGAAGSTGAGPVVAERVLE